jgi:hypothetical protein
VRRLYLPFAGFLHNSPVIPQALRVTLHHSRRRFELGAAPTPPLCVRSACEGERVEIAAASKSEQAKKCLCLAPIGFHVLYRYNRGANKKPVQLAMVAIRVLFIFSSVKLIFFSKYQPACGMAKLKV